MPKFSPANYGGPLVDLQGRVLGVSGAHVAARNQRNGGRGMVRLRHRLRRTAGTNQSRSAAAEQGRRFESRTAGRQFAPGDPYADPPVIAASHPKSPAALAGLKAGDRIAEINGAKVNSPSELRHQLGPLYAGEKVAVVVMRGDDRIEHSAELIAKLPLYIHPFLGVLPKREFQQHDAALDAGESKNVPSETDKTKDKADSDKSTSHPAGVAVRQVYPDSPAAKAGIQAGDRIISFNGDAVKDRLALQEKVAALEPRDSAKVEFVRDGKPQTVEVKLATLPEAVPEKLAAARDANPPPDEKSAATGKIEIKIPEAPSGAPHTCPTSTTRTCRMG